MDYTLGKSSWMGCSSEEYKAHLAVRVKELRTAELQDDEQKGI